MSVIRKQRERIAELEAENHRLQTDIHDLEFVNKWSGERIAELEGFIARGVAEDYDKALKLLAERQNDERPEQIRSDR